MSRRSIFRKSLEFNDTFSFRSETTKLQSLDFHFFAGVAFVGFSTNTRHKLRQGFFFPFRDVSREEWGKIENFLILQRLIG